MIRVGWLDVVFPLMTNWRTCVYPFFSIAISVLNLPFNSHSPHIVGVGGVQKRGEGSHTTYLFYSTILPPSNHIVILGPPNIWTKQDKNRTNYGVFLVPQFGLNKSQGLERCALKSAVDCWFADCFILRTPLSEWLWNSIFPFSPFVSSNSLIILVTSGVSLYSKMKFLYKIRLCFFVFLQFLPLINVHVLAKLVVWVPVVWNLTIRW